MDEKRRSHSLDLTESCLLNLFDAGGTACFKLCAKH